MQFDKDEELVEVVKVDEESKAAAAPKSPAAKRTLVRANMYALEGLWQALVEERIKEFGDATGYGCDENVLEPRPDMSISKLWKDYEDMMKEHEAADKKRKSIRLMKS